MLLQAARRGDLVINFTEKEAYLTPAEFTTVFKMNQVGSAQGGARVFVANEAARGWGVGVAALADGR